MRLELVGGTQVRGQSAAGGQGDASTAAGLVLAQLDAVQRDLASVRERLQILIDRAADLRMRLHATGAQR